MLKTDEVLPPGSDGLAEGDRHKYAPWLPDRFDAKKRLKKPLPVAIFPNQFDRRITAQRSCFTVHGLKKDSIDALFPRAQRLLAKIVIPGYRVLDVRSELEGFSVDEAPIYPDLEGLGKCVARWTGDSKPLPHEEMYTRLKPSPIEGVGVFAITKIKKGTMLFSGDADEVRWIDASDLPRNKALREFYQRFAIIKNGKNGKPKRYGCPRNFHRLTMSWYINDPKRGEKPNVICDDNYNFRAALNIKEGEELTVDSTTYSDHAAKSAPRSKPTPR